MITPTDNGADVVTAWAGIGLGVATLMDLVSLIVGVLTMLVLMTRLIKDGPSTVDYLKKKLRQWFW